MTIKEENFLYRFGNVINTLDSVTEMLTMALNQMEYNSAYEAKNILELQTPIIAEVLVNLKEIYSASGATPYEITAFNKNIADRLGITFEIVKKKYPCYKLTFPVSTSKKKMSTELKQLLADSYMLAVKEYISQIERIAKPVIYFQHCFDKYGGKISIKDVDNYETSAYINLLQMHIIKDDREAATFHVNKYNAGKSETIIYVFPQKNLIEFLN